MRLHLDFETYSECPIDRGTYRYAADTSTEALMLAWAVDDDGISLWDINADPTMPGDLDAALTLADELWAYNAAFERRIMADVLGIEVPIHKWRCTQVLAYSLSFAGSMDQVLTRFHVEQNKDPEGKRLIRKFSMPQAKNQKVRRWYPADDPIAYEQFKIYCRQDVHVERMLYHRCMEVTPDVNWAHYALDQEINDQGLPIDMVLVHKAMSMAAVERDKLMEDARSWTGLENPNSRTQLLDWLDDYGFPLPNLQKDTVARALDSDSWDLSPPTPVREVLKLRQQLAKGSVAKWSALNDSVLSTRRLSGAFQFLGAGRTGRWAGRKFQPHNLPRPTIDDPDTAADIIVEFDHDMVSMLYDRPMEVLASTLRGALKASSGKSLVVADLSGIEGRLAGWFCNCKWINKCYKQGLDMYRELAALMYDKDPDDVTKDERNYHKPVALGGQYQLGGKGLVKYAASMGVELEQVQAQSMVDLYRSLCPEVVGMWNELSEAAMRVTNHGGTMHVGAVAIARNMEFLQIKMPAGRSIYYYRPKVLPCKMPWRDQDGDEVWRDCFTYMGKNQRTTQWERLGVHGGSILENIIQAMGRDVLMKGIGRACNVPLDVIGHVHDEIIVETAYPDSGLASLIACMTREIEWAPGLRLGADGYTAQRFRKG